MKKITVWQRYSESHKDWEHNHIEDGHIISDKPTGNTKEQKRLWGGGKWKYKHAHLTDKNVVVE